jgi:two-component system, OmpR family, alkaline phosphatase synthesis response regulator PhoP
MKLKGPFNILAVDDEEDICEIIKFNLESEGYKVDTALSAEEALQKPLENYHLFILDIMMNGISGYKLADEIRKNKRLDTPIIFLSAKNSENDKLTGFTLGADDYITKPFSLRELVARVKVVIRRYGLQNTGKNSNIKISGIELDIERKKIYVEGSKVDLTPLEYNIMQMLLKNYGKVFNREEILNYAWKGDSHVVDRTVDVHLTRLRKKLGSYGKYLITRSGHGYCFEIE